MDGCKRASILPSGISAHSWKAPQELDSLEKVSRRANLSQNFQAGVPDSVVMKAFSLLNRMPTRTLHIL